jgi:hypothetical protein
MKFVFDKKTTVPFISPFSSVDTQGLNIELNAKPEVLKSTLANELRGLQNKHSYKGYSLTKYKLFNEFLSLNNIDRDEWQNTNGKKCCTESAFRARKDICMHKEYFLFYIHNVGYSNPIEAHGLKDQFLIDLYMSCLKNVENEFSKPNLDESMLKLLGINKLTKDQVQEQVFSEFAIKLKQIELGKQSDVFLWRSETLDQAFEMPIGSLKIDMKYLPIVNSFHVFEKPIETVCRISKHIADKSILPEQIKTDWACSTDHISVTKISETRLLVSGSCQHFSSESITIDNGYVYTDNDVKDVCNTIIPLLVFLTTKATETKFISMPRAEKRRLKKLKVKPEDFKTSVVYLRRFKNKDNEYIPNATRNSDGYRDKNGSWWVRGHMRNQWYGSENNRHQKLIFIDPFIKGQGKMRDKTYIVRH